MVWNWQNGFSVSLHLNMFTLIKGATVYFTEIRGDTESTPCKTEVCLNFINLCYKVIITDHNHWLVHSMTKITITTTRDNYKSLVVSLI